MIGFRLRPAKYIVGHCIHVVVGGPEHFKLPHGMSWHAQEFDAARRLTIFAVYQSTRSSGAQFFRVD